jgi:hypothetical protein
VCSRRTTHQLDFVMLKRDWKPLATYEGFERIASYVVMFFISIRLCAGEWAFSMRSC